MHQIEINNVSKYFYDKKLATHALDSLDLNIKQGEFICLLGESGCGKSSLLRLISGLESPSNGVININGKPITGTSHERGMVFQSPALLPWLNVEDNIALGFNIRRENVPHEHIQNVIELVGLEGFEKAKPRNLSGGMAQRATIARAMVNTPEILLMDEPFSALDALTRIKMQKEITRIWQKMQTTAIFVTHDIDEAVALATRIIVLTPRPGRILKDIKVDLEYPRSHQSNDFIKLRGQITEDLSKTLETSTSEGISDEKGR